MIKGQPNRLDTEGRHHLAGTAIDRKQPLQFRLDGRTISGFVGDTVLSAILASGIDSVGRRQESPLALTARYAPAIAPAGLARDPQQALAMERTPALAGGDYVTLPIVSSRRAIGAALRQFSLAKRGLALDLDRAGAMQRPWLTGSAETGATSDLIVVGGGLAGLSAAVAGARAGLSVTLIEASLRLGGHARLFGTLDGEETPDHCITRLVDVVARTDAITVLTRAEAFAARPGAIRVHVHVQESLAATSRPRVLDLHAANIILATGSIERLPVFPGNRLPGVIGALEAFEMAHHYGVWPGQSALFATVSSPAYRLAMLARDAGITVPRIIDGRPQPQSRFIEFSKAYGITLAAGSIPAAAKLTKQRLSVTPQLALDGLERVEEDVLADRLIACGGWQPDLTLWHMAGGESRWNVGTARLEPLPGPTGIVLAGSAAGYFSNRACLASGNDAVDMLLGRRRGGVQELIIDPVYETPDAATPVRGDVADATAPAFLDGGRRYVERPRAKPSRWPAWLPFGPKAAGWSLADTPQPLDIADIAAGVQLAAIPAASAGIVAQERVAMVAIARAVEVAAPRPTRADGIVVPSYLNGRFGGQSGLWVIAPNEQRLLEIGALIHPNADASAPLNAVGVVIGMVDGAAIALISTAFAQPEKTAAVLEQGRDIAIRVIAPYSLV